MLQPNVRALAAGLAVLAMAFALASRAHAQPQPAPPDQITTPSAQTLYSEGQSGRYLVDGPWLIRPDDAANLQLDTSTAGWSQIAGVPYAWNATDSSAASFAGTVVWYRKDFTLPAAAAGTRWILRFESVNYGAKVWLNGHLIGSHTGEFLPFEIALPPHDLQLVNRLVLRIDDHHGPRSLPGDDAQLTGHVSGGWWNYGGILREVYLRSVRTVDVQSVQVHTDLACASCAARVSFQAQARSYSTRTRVVTLQARFGAQTRTLGGRRLKPGASATFSGTIVVAHPQLWGPGHPYLYDATVTAVSGGAVDSTYSLQTGVRSISVHAGHLYLNGQPVHLRGVGLQEDSPDNGAALNDTQRAALIGAAQNLGADLIRTQYPLSPYEEELADRDGILLWSEIPVFSTPESILRSPSYRRSALDELRQNIVDNGSHPSVAIWSIANELSSRPGSGQRAYIAAAVRLAHHLDPTRPVGLAVAGYPSVACSSAYRPLDVVGVNDYFGWYPGPSGQIADRSLLGSYLDKARGCFPRQALMVTEFGAEANRDGPVQERGTYAFQSDFVAYHLGVFASRPYLSAAVYWALEDFRVRPGWTGGDPLPNPPIFDKGLLDFNGVPKPAYSVVQAIYRATRQVG